MILGGKTLKQPKKTVILKETPQIKGISNEVITQDVARKEFKKMEQFMLVSGTVQQSNIDSKLEDWEDKMYGNQKNKLTLEEELELRKSQRDMKKKRKVRDEFYQSFLQPRDPEKNIVNRLQMSTSMNQMERDDLMELYNKIAKSYQIKDAPERQTKEKEYKFPQNENISRKVIIKQLEKKEEIENQLNEQNANQSQISNSIKYAQESEGRQKKMSMQFQKRRNSDYYDDDPDYDSDDDDDYDDDDDDDDDDYGGNSIMDFENMTERSNFDKFSTFSKARSQAEKDWEYNSLKDYNISDIPKLTEEIDNQAFVPQLGGQQKDDIKEGSQNDVDKVNDENKDKNDHKETTKSKYKNRKKIQNIKQERSYEEFQLLNIHEKIQFMAQNDLIQKISFGYSQGSVIHPENQVQYYRDITCQARDLLAIDKEYRGAYYEQDRLALLEIEDIYIDLSNITFQDISNIVSDRVPEHLIESYTNPKYVAENFNKFSYVPEKNSNQVVDKLTYTQSLQDVKKSQYVEMKSYYQKMKTWQDKEYQVSHKDIVNETKSVTDWLMEDLHHIRKATISSFDLDFNPKINKVLQTQLYHKFEHKLLLLLQIILYRENIPQYRVPKDILGRPEATEEEQREQRLKVEKRREEDEKRFYHLFTPESQLVQDLKKLLRDVKSISGKNIDGRSKTELLRIFLVDYNEIVKFKSEQLNRVKQIEDELGQINFNFSQIEGKSLYERLYEAKIGHIKNQESDELSDVQMLNMLNKNREKLQKERQSILLNSAQIFQIGDQDPLTQQGKESAGSSPRLSPNKAQSEMLPTQKSKSNLSANKIIKQATSSDNRTDQDYKNNQIEYQQISKQDLYIPLDQANASNRSSKSGIVPQKQSNSAQKLMRSNTSALTPQRNRDNLMTPISTTKSRMVSDMGASTNSRQLHKSSTQKSIFSQYNQQSTLVDISPKDFSDFEENKSESRVESRLTNRQIINATPTQEFYYDRERQDEPQRRTPDKYSRKLQHSNTTYIGSSNSKENEIRQIKLFQNSRTQDQDKFNITLHKSPMVSEFDKDSKSSMNQSRSKSPLQYNPRQNQQGMNTSTRMNDNELVKTKMERMKQRQTSNVSLNASQISSTPLKQTTNKLNSTSISSSANKSFSNTKTQSCLSNIQEKDWKQVFQNAKYRQQYSNKK